MKVKAPNWANTFQASRLGGLGHYVWDVKEDRCIYCSQQHANIHGVSIKEYMARSSTLNGQAHPEDIALVREAYDDLRKGGTFHIEFRLLRPDGTVRVVREIGHPVFDDEGHVIQEVGTSQDITDFVDMQAQIDAAQARYRDLFEQSPVPFMEEDWTEVLQLLKAREATTANELHEFLYDNPSEIKKLYNSCETIRISRKFAELYGAKTIAEFEQSLKHSNADQDEIDGFVFALVQFFFGESQVSYKARETRLDGKEIQTRITFSKPLEHAESWDRILISAEDITDEANLELARKKAQHFEALGQISGRVAHDFNNLLTIVSAAAEYAMMTKDHSADILGEIITASQRGAKLTSQMLSYAGQQISSPKITDLGKSVNDMKLLMSTALGANFQISIRVSDGELSSLVDPGLFNDAVMNLLINARDAMPQGGEVELVIRLAHKEDLALTSLAHDDPYGYICVSVRDTGSGMSDTILAKAIEPFFSTKSRGTGLGLSSVYGFATQAKGAMNIVSSIGVGTTVTLLLPAVMPNRLFDTDHS